MKGKDRVKKSSTSLEIGLLSHSDFTAWDELVTRSPHGTTFHYSWWLKATGCDFKILAARDASGRLVAGIPLPMRRWAPLRLIHMPDDLTPYGGPLFDLSFSASQYERTSFLRQAGEALARAICGYDSFSCWVGPQGPDLQGFLWAGFRAELGYTYRFEANLSPEGVWDRMAPKHRYEVTKAQSRGVMVQRSDDVSAVINLVSGTFHHHGIPVPFKTSHAAALAREALARGHATIYLAHGTGSEPAAGILVIHDARSSYQLLVGINPRQRTLGAGNLTEWEAVQDALRAGRAYDFEGSALRAVERHYRHWGAIPVPVWRLERAGTLLGAAARVLRRLPRYHSDL